MKFLSGKKIYPHPPQPLEYAQASTSRAWEKFTYCVNTPIVAVRRPLAQGKRNTSWVELFLP